jgi:hypothetical protein
MRYLSILFILATFDLFGQTVIELYPTLGYLVDKSPEKEIEFNQQKQKCEQVWKTRTDELSVEEKAIFDRCNEEFDGVESYYEILGPGCSWYCGGGLDTLNASSELKQQGENNYSAKNAHDLNYKTAWIEGVSGYGIGQYLVYHLPPENPRITKIIVVNGYVKSDKAWTENSRVKKLKLYIDDKPFAILNLEDVKNEQIFTFNPIGNGDRANFKLLKTKPWWTMKFEIMDVYKGKKYDDTVISEIYFDGIDVH